MIKAVIFDMDGVIVDSEPIYKEIDQEIFWKYGFDISPEEISNYVGINLLEAWTEILEKYEIDEEYSNYEVEDFIEEHVNVYYQKLSEKEDLSLMPGVKDWFEFFKDNGYKMIIASSSYSPVIEYIYQTFELGQYMSGYVDGDAVENGKPAPDIFLKAADKIDVEPEKCLVIEDSEHGVNAAKSAGAKVVAFNRAKDSTQDLSKADLIIEKFNQENLNKVLK